MRPHPQRHGLTSLSTNMRQRKRHWNWYESSEAQSPTQSHMSSNKTTHPNPFQTVLGTKYMSLYRPFHSSHHIQPNKEKAKIKSPPSTQSVLGYCLEDKSVQGKYFFPSPCSSQLYSFSYIPQSLERTLTKTNENHLFFRVQASQLVPLRLPTPFPPEKPLK